MRAKSDRLLDSGIHAHFPAVGFAIPGTLLVRFSRGFSVLFFNSGFLDQAEVDLLFELINSGDLHAQEIACFEHAA